MDSDAFGSAANPIPQLTRTGLAAPAHTYLTNMLPSQIHRAASPRLSSALASVDWVLPPDQCQRPKIAEAPLFLDAVKVTAASEDYNGT